MIHDFMITERFGIVPDLPLEMDPPGACKHKRFLFHLNKQGRCRYGVFPRTAKDSSEIIWVETESHYVFHFANSWDYNENGTDFVVFYAVVWPDLDLSWEQKESFDIVGNQVFEKFVINLETKVIERTVVIDFNSQMEFPMFALDQTGYRSRYCYLATKEPGLQVQDKFCQQFDCLVKVDLETDTIVQKTVPNAAQTFGEVYFQPRDARQAEDDGYLMTTIYDSNLEKSFFVMWDAKSFAVVAKVQLEQRVPYGFHSTFVRREDY